jgi:preprotein translocase subunit SecF
MALSRRERREQRKKLLKEQRLGQLKSLEEQEKKIEKKSEYKGLLHIYDKHYVKLLVITITLMILAIGAIAYQVATTGDFMIKGVSLKGGMVITVPVQKQVDMDELEKLLKSNFPRDDMEVRSIAEFGTQKAIIITSDNFDTEKQIVEVITPLIPNAATDVSVETTGSSLGGGFFNQTMLAMLIAFVCMGLVVFASFRQFTPSMMVITCVFADIIETLAVVNLLGIRISTAGIAAFLMLIGYSVDTDILLTSRVLKSKEGTVFSRVLGAAKTGLLMTFTAIVAVTIGLIFTQSGTIKEIMTITLIGLIFDIFNTWIQNVAMLRHHVEHMHKKKSFAPAKAEVVDEDDDKVEEDDFAEDNNLAEDNIEAEKEAEEKQHEQHEKAEEHEEHPADSEKKE